MLGQMDLVRFIMGDFAIHMRRGMTTVFMIYLVIIGNALAIISMNLRIPYFHFFLSGRVSSKGTLLP